MFNGIWIRNIASIISTYNLVANFNRNNSNSSRGIMVALLKGGLHMTIVVKKVPKALRGIVKFIFGIKDTKE